MRFGAVLAAAGVFVLLNLTVPDARAQSPAAAPAPAPTDAEPAAPMPTPAELESLLAPIALYPDPLLAQILMAATYPLEVVEADRWLQGPENAALKGDALAQALAREDWDPSVKSLIPFPRILHMMDGELDWTERVGEAFIADQGAVMEAVQRLRSRAQSSGHLATAPQAVVTPEPEAITIEPPSPETVYYPSCDPSLVYGDWLYPAYSRLLFSRLFHGRRGGRVRLRLVRRAGRDLPLGLASLGLAPTPARHRPAPLRRTQSRHTAHRRRPLGARPRAPARGSLRGAGDPRAIHGKPDRPADRPGAARLSHLARLQTLCRATSAADLRILRPRGGGALAGRARRLQPHVGARLCAAHRDAQRRRSAAMNQDPTPIVEPRGRRC